MLRIASAIEMPFVYLSSYHKNSEIVTGKSSQCELGRNILLNYMR